MGSVCPGPKGLCFQHRLGLGLNADNIVTELAPGMPAADAGVQVGDRVTIVDGHALAGQLVE